MGCTVDDHNIVFLKQVKRRGGDEMFFQLRSWNFWAVMAALASHGESACFLIFLVGVSNGRRTVTAWAGMWVGKSVCSAHCKQKIVVVNHRDRCTAMLPSISIWLTLTRYR